MDRLVTRSRSSTPARRLRVVGALVLLLGLTGAGLLHRRAAGSSNPALDRLLPGYSQQRLRQNELLLGGWVATMVGWEDELKDPNAQAVMVAGLSAVVALGCFRVASLLESAAAGEARARLSSERQ